MRTQQFFLIVVFAAGMMIGMTACSAPAPEPVTEIPPTAAASPLPPTPEPATPLPPTETPQPENTPEPSPTPYAGAGRLVFDSTRDGTGYREVFIMEIGTEAVQLTGGENNNFAGPCAPTGDKILYTSFGLTTSDIWVMNPDGTLPLNLTNSEDVDDSFPAWSPDSSHILFTSRMDGNNEIYLMSMLTSEVTRLTDDPRDDFGAAWSPDGSLIAFVSDRDSDQLGIYDLYVMNADGSGVTRLTDDDAIDYHPTWSPDGSQIAFRSHHDGPADIYVINVDGTGLYNLTESEANEWAPSWSPDGSLIAFQTDRDGNWEIYAIQPDGTGLVNLTNNPADDQSPFWCPQP
ncbi:MAG: PD40 domain-containing protein [Anaerolineae bacterium]|nr:PD40 domain-containing protein [Anaerolineae bacterium]